MRGRPRLPRRDGDESRQRLLRAALGLFAARGYAGTSTRELALAAGSNVAAIAYHFGDKAGLYHAAFVEPLGDVEDDLARFADPALTLPAALAGFYAGFVEPLRDGETARLCMKLHFREMLEPTGLLSDGVAHGIRPLHDALVALLCRTLGVAQADEEVLRLAICLAAPGVHLHVGHDVTEALAPGLVAAPGALDRWMGTLVRHGVAMVEAERARRAAGAGGGP